MRNTTTSTGTDPLCKACGRPVINGGVYGNAGIYHPECVRGPQERGYRMHDGGYCPFCNGTGKNPNSVIPCGVHGATSLENADVEPTRGPKKMPNNTKEITGPRDWLSRLVRLHVGRSWARLTIYLMALLILAPISVTLELLREFFDSAAERVNGLGKPLQKWAYFRKPNASGEGPPPSRPESK